LSSKPNELVELARNGDDWRNELRVVDLGTGPANKSAVTLSRNKRGNAHNSISVFYQPDRHVIEVAIADRERTVNPAAAVSLKPRGVPTARGPLPQTTQGGPVPPGYQHVPDGFEVVQSSRVIPPGQKAVPESAVVLPPGQKAVPESAIILAPGQKAVPENVVILAPGQKAVSQSAIILAPNQKAVPESAVVLSPGQKAVSASDVVLAPNQKAIPSDAFWLTKESLRTMGVISYGDLGAKSNSLQNALDIWYSNPSHAQYIVGLARDWLRSYRYPE
jgi:hypothetical protein